MARAAITLLLSSAAALAACSLDWSVPSDAGTSGDGSPGSVNVADGGLDATTDAMGDAAAETSAADAPGTDTRVESPCSPPCSSSQICVTEDSSCSKTVTPFCADRSEVCAEPGKVCGCDGVVYASACEAITQGTVPTQTDQCTPPVGTVQCGDLYYCTLPSEYCLLGAGERAYCVPDLSCGGSCECLAEQHCPDGGSSPNCTGGEIDCFD